AARSFWPMQLPRLSRGGLNFPARQGPKAYYKAPHVSRRCYGRDRGAKSQQRGLFRGGGGSYLRGGDVGGPESSAKPESKMDRNHLRREHGNFWFDLAAALGVESQRSGTKNAAGLSRPQRHPLIFDRGGRDIDGRGLNRDHLVSGTAVIGVEGHAFTAFFAEQGLPDCSLIGNNVTIGVAVPGAKDGIRYFLRRLHIAQYGDCANGNLGSIGIGEIGAASAVQHLFELGLAPH